MASDAPTLPLDENSSQSLPAWDWSLHGSSFGSIGDCLNEFADGSGTTNMLEGDLKAEGSAMITTTTEVQPGAKVLVNLIDTDSGSEGEFNRNQAEVKSKRRLPNWISAKGNGNGNWSNAKGNGNGPHNMPALDRRLQNLNFGHTRERAGEFANGSATTSMSDLKTNRLGRHSEAERHHGAKLLVDLTDLDSESESETDQNQGEDKGKRKLPGWVEPRQKPSKDMHVKLPLCEVTGKRKLPSCVEPAQKTFEENSAIPPSHKEAYNLYSKLMKAQDPLGTGSSYNSSSALSQFGGWLAGFANPGGNVLNQSLLSNSSACGSAMPHAGPNPRSGSTHEEEFCISASMSDKGLKRVLPSTLALQSGLAKQYSPGHCRDYVSWDPSQVFELKEEACPDEGLMTVSLLKHQRIALAWMEKQERGARCAGGILADDQGLGKTVTTVALILKAKPPAPSSYSEKQVCWETSAVDLDEEDDVQCHEGKRPMESELSYPSAKQHQEKKIVILRGRPQAGTLVVCPTSVLRQWAQEIKEKVTEAVGLSVLLYHGANRTKDPSELAKHDIVLTTYSVVSSEVPKQPFANVKEADERDPAQYGLTCIMSCEKKQKTAKSNKNNKKGRKKDTVDDFDSGPLAKVAWFRVVLDEAQNIKNARTQMARACWGLRAKRRWCLSGTPIQNRIDDLYSYFRFLKFEPFSAYKSFQLEIKDPIARDPNFGYRKLQCILQKIMLRRTKSTLINGNPIITLPKKIVSLEQVDFSTEERNFYTNLELHSRKQFQMYAAAGTVQRNYVNILLMILRLRQACDHGLLVKDHHSHAFQRSMTESASKLSEEKRTILFSVLVRNGDACSICMDAPEDAVITLCAHVFCWQCISERLTNDDCINCPHPECHAPLNPSAVYSWSALKDPSDDVGKVEQSVDTLMETTSKNVPESSKIKAIIDTLQRLPTLESSRTAGRTNGELSLHITDADSSSPLERGRTEKALVFSQWTSMLDLLEISLKKEGFDYRRLDGTMSIQSRDRALSDFKLLPEVTVMIMSLKAASLGLNLVTASHVLLIDVWWNPTTEEQAIDRAHRIGQTRDVHVSRFTVKNTIEDRMLALQDQKRHMVASAFGEDGSIDQRTRLTEEEMRYLFRV